MKSLWLIPLLLLCFTLRAIADQPAPGLPADSLQPPHDKAAILPLTGAVDNVMFNSLQRRVDLARKAGCTLIIYHLDNSGGLATSALEIAAFTRKLSTENMHVVAWIDSRAIGPGAIVALSCQQIVMSSTAVLGDCSSLETPESNGSAGPLVTELNTSAQQNNYNPALLRAMLIPSIEIFKVRNNTTGEIRFVDPVDKDKLLAEEVATPAGAHVRPWVYVDQTDSPDQVLTVNADLALQMALSKRTLNTEQELRAALNIRGDLLPYGFDWLELTTRFLTQPWIRALLFVFMLIFGFIELSHPGVTFPAIAAIICLLLLVGAPYLTGLAHLWEILAIVIGVAIIVLDLFIFGGIGYLAIPGFLLVAIGLVASFIPIEPGAAFSFNSQSWSGLRTGLAVLVCGSLASLAGFAILSKYLHMTPGLRRLQLAPATGLPSKSSTIPTDLPADIVFLGAIGITATDLRPAGKVRFDQHLVDVVSFGSFIPRNTEVLVIEISGPRIVVKPRPPTDPSQVAT